MMPASWTRSRTRPRALSESSSAWIASVTSMTSIKSTKKHEAEAFRAAVETARHRGTSWTQLRAGLPSPNGLESG